MICLALVSYQQKQLMYKMYGENSLKLDTSWVEFPDAAISPEAFSGSFDSSLVAFAPATRSR